MAKAAPVPDPSSAPLPNPKHEAFAFGVAHGKPGAEAYRDAGYSPNSADANAARLSGSESIAARIAYLRQQREMAIASAATVDAQRIQTELEHVALSDIGTLFEEGPDATVRLLPLTRWPEGTRRAVSSVKVKRYLEGSGDNAREVETTEFRLWPKLEAISQLREHMGLKKDDDTTPTRVEVVLVAPPAR